MSEISKKILLGDQEILIETGKIARQANGSIMITCDGTTILATVAARKEAKAERGRERGDYFRQVFETGHVGVRAFARETPILPLPQRSSRLAFRASFFR